MFVRCMVVFQGGTGVPEDRFVNTLHFQHPSSDLQVAANELGPFVEDFYKADNSTLSISGYLSEFINRAAEMRFYDMADSLPRVPVVRAWTLNPVGLTGNLPEEVSVVLSLRGAPPITPRRRGRLYIGPLVSGAATTGGALLPTRVATTFSTDLCVAANTLRTGVESLSIAAFWAIRSITPVVNYVRVEGGWVDNALDTQRRRGPDATSRVQWGEVLG